MAEETLVHASELPASAILAKRRCANCNPPLFRRVSRATLMERTLFSWLGFYPWECISCRSRRLFRDKGRRTRKSGSAEFR